MDSIKAGQPLIDYIKLCYRANQPTLLIGVHGIGKSQLLEQAAQELGIGFISRDLSLMEPPDLVGLPKLKGQSTVYLPPEFLPTRGQGLLVFEELNRCEKFMRAPCLQLLTARVLNDYRLPDGWLPIAAINPADGDYEVAELDLALLSRFAQVHVRADPSEWLRWAKRNGVHSGVIQYVENDKSVFEAPESNPRSWTSVSEVLWAAETQKAPTQTLRAVVLGLVGDKRGAAFLRTLTETEHPLIPEEILESYEQHRSEIRRWVRQGRLDLVEPSLQSLLIYLQPSANFELIRETRAQWNNLGRFLMDLPGDLREMAKSLFEEREYPFPTPKAKKPKAK